MHSNLSCSHQQSWAGPLLLRKRAPDTIHSTSAHRFVGPYPVSLSRQTLKQWGQSQSFVDGRLLGLPGLYHRHAIDTFNTCSWGPTQQSLIDTGGGYNHLRVPPGFQFNQTLPKILKFKFKGPMAATWPSDHSTIYRDLQLRLAMANVLQILARSSRVIWKVFIMHLRFQSTPTNLMHNHS
jgi:hypothetical protein